MKLGDHKHSKVTELDFSGRFSFAQNKPKKGQKCPKNDIFGNFPKLCHRCQISNNLNSLNIYKLNIYQILFFIHAQSKTKQEPHFVPCTVIKKHLQE